jgi:hypothetical protein
LSATAEAFILGASDSPHTVRGSVGLLSSQLFLHMVPELLYAVNLTL